MLNTCLVLSKGLLSAKQNMETCLALSKGLLGAKQFVSQFCQFCLMLGIFEPILPKILSIKQILLSAKQF